MFELNQSDYKSWARGLKKSGYATDPNYAEKLISIIEEYQLFNFDNSTFPVHEPEEIILVQESPSQPTEKEVQKPKRFADSKAFSVRNDEHIVKPGETMQTIANRYNIDLDLFYFQNRLPPGSEPYPGQKLKLQGVFHWGKKPKKIERKYQEPEYLFEDNSMKVIID